MRGDVRLSVSASECIALPSVSHCRCISFSCSLTIRRASACHTSSASCGAHLPSPRAPSDPSQPVSQPITQPAPPPAPQPAPQPTDYLASLLPSRPPTYLLPTYPPMPSPRRCTLLLPIAASIERLCVCTSCTSAARAFTVSSSVVRQRVCCLFAVSSRSCHNNRCWARAEYLGFGR